MSGHGPDCGAPGRVSARQEVRLPQVTERRGPSVVVAWFKTEGSPVRAGEPLLELQYEKVSYEIAAPASGVLARIAAPANAVVDAGDLLGEIATSLNGGVTMEIGRERLLWLYERMQLIRQFELAVHDNFSQGKIPGFVHLYAGEEAVATGVCAHLRDDDYLTSTHRGHGHCVAKGCDLKGMMAEIFGKATGLCKGKGGSMHIADVSKGMLGANGIVGGGFPLAVGAGLTAKTLGTDRVVVCFFSDGAANQGTFHEGVNLAAIWKLPVVFVCENNMYAESTPVWYACAARNIADRAVGYDVPGVIVDGQDVFAVYEAAGEAVRRARAGEGPSLIECKTYRMFGHFEGDTQTYKRPDDVESVMGRRDPIHLFRDTVVQRGLLGEAELDETDERARREVAAALDFAYTSPLPAVAELETDVWASA